MDEIVYDFILFVDEIYRNKLGIKKSLNFDGLCEIQISGPIFTLIHSKIEARELISFAVPVIHCDLKKKQ